MLSPDCGKLCDPRSEQRRYEFGISSTLGITKTASRWRFGNLNITFSSSADRYGVASTAQKNEPKAQGVPSGIEVEMGARCFSSVSTLGRL